VTLADGTEEASRFLLLATGVSDELPPVAGIAACYGRSVFHCPYCDGWEWRDRRLAVVGTGAAGAGLALSLKPGVPTSCSVQTAPRIERRSRGPAQPQRHRDTPRTDRSLEHDQGFLSSIVFDGAEPAPCDALFFTTGQHLQGDLAVRLGCAFNSRGTVTTGLLSNTNVARLFVAGDASYDSQFVVVAAAEGVKAAVAINKELQKGEVLP
jgi:thioredoxin reductase